ncbi:hypothetical protein SD10_16960 [Spirosoma radiotolerans]|uniref:Uncharacterized protein n=1 Tax=Spirosoma radiotolerans TaxID=1379870 RepID=A0A0E3ZXC0_9BACT|nr:hypothetical protein SD10_16960 [Spirosoma radiotolerans]
MALMPVFSASIVRKDQMPKKPFRKPYLLLVIVNTLTRFVYYMKSINFPPMFVANITPYTAL